MAGGSGNYKLLLEGQLDTTKLEAQVKNFAGKNLLKLKTEYDQAGTKKLESELQRIKSIAQSIGKITLVDDKNGQVSKAVVNYTDKLGNAVKETIKFRAEIERTATSTQNLDKELYKSALNAEKFLAKAKNLNQTPSVVSAMGKAEQIKVAVNEGDITKVRKLNDELSIMKASIQSGASGLSSWTAGMQNAIKQTLEYAFSIGLVYGALNQMAQGIEYVTQLNKEMTNIQLLQVDGARTDEQISNLALRYNSLAKEVGATTLEVSRGI